jgi:hypothetical protein
LETAIGVFTGAGVLGLLGLQSENGCGRGAVLDAKKLMMSRLSQASAAGKNEKTLTNVCTTPPTTNTLWLNFCAVVASILRAAEVGNIGAQERIALPKP